MGKTITTFNIRNRSLSCSNDGTGNGSGNDKRLVLNIEDIHAGLTIENAVLAKTLIESWLRMNGVQV